MTETSVCVSIPSEHDIEPRASGSLLPGTSVKLLDDQGMEITNLDQPGEILVQAPSVVLGYLHNEKANAATFVHDDDGRWIRTGDIGLMTISSSGNEQLVIVDRIKELIKVMVSISDRFGAPCSALTYSRVIKLHLPSSKLTCWNIRRWRTVLSYRYLTIKQAKFLKHSLSSLPNLHPRQISIFARRLPAG